MGNDTNIAEMLSGMLSNNENVPDNVKEMLNSFISSSNTENSPNISNPPNDTNNDSSNTTTNSNNDNSNPFNNIDFDMILKAKRIAQTMSNNNDPRKNLLLSLKPYLKEDKKDKIDQYIQFLSLSKVIEEFGPDLFGSGKHDK